MSVWSEQEWHQLESKTRKRALEIGDPEKAWQLIVRQSRAIMRAYSTSFFIVSRFLPSYKREMVEIIYASVRYPDEIVDNFHLDAAERLRRLDQWEASFDAGLKARDPIASLEREIPCFLVGFIEVMRLTGIPTEYYRAFLKAMRLDVRPRNYSTFDHLINSYVYGSAIVVGYFLTHVYGSAKPQDFPRALESARLLGIALQLTNFLRDVREDQRRGRVYLPQDLLQAEGIDHLDVDDPSQHPALIRAAKRVAAIADSYYRRVQGDLDAFAEDCRPAIKACIDLYSLLNDRILHGNRGLAHRESLPLAEKLRPLPLSKLWKIPLAYLMR